jgi:hypothetical protein
VSHFKGGVAEEKGYGKFFNSALNSPSKKIKNLVDLDKSR